MKRAWHFSTKPLLQPMQVNFHNSVRNMIGTLNETFLFFNHFRLKLLGQRFLEQVLEKCGSTSRKEKLKGLCKTRWVHGKA